MDEQYIQVPRAAQEAINGSLSELSSPRASTFSPNGMRNALPPDNHDRIQVINDEKQFNQDLNGQVDKWGLLESGFGYDVVAVFGSQSTGKSTLLNRLFGTTFDVMDETKRQQTTKGIWMCRGKGMNVMVMDVEGTDGRERGEDQDFERKSALFSLASSEVLLINMWEHQVGLFQGANMGLLKTVFEVNLGLFGKRSAETAKQRTLLLFVIRDHIGQTPLANLQNTLTQDLNRIWESLSKPEELQNARLEDYFDLAFTTLPHKVLAGDKFEQAVVDLRKRFTDRDREDYVFKPAYHKRIPADGVAHYMEGIWEQVQTNKDLDLPTQQELLAQFRCDEIAGVALEAFTTQSKAIRKPVEAGKVVEGLGGMMKGWRGEALTRFDRDASRYHRNVYIKKRADLVAQLDSVLHPLYLGQLKNLAKWVLANFKKAMTDGVKGESYSFADVVSNGRTKWESEFTTAAEEAHIPETDWSHDDDLEQLRAEMTAVADHFRSDETKKMVNAIERTIKNQIAEPVDLELSKAQPDMWDKVLTAFNATLSKGEAIYLAKATSFNCTDEENETSLGALRQRAWTALIAKIKENTADASILTKLRSNFEDRFRYDDNGVPRVWKPEDDMDTAFQKARDDTLNIIPLYAKIAPANISLLPSLPSDSFSPNPSDPDSEFDFESTLIVLTETKQLDLTTRFRRDADAYYVEAKRSTVSSVAQIPTWMYGVLVVLGWNEAMVVLFNPVYFAFMLVALGGAYAAVQLGLVGPIMTIIATVTREIQRQASDRLREHFSEPQAQVNAPHRTNTTSSNGHSVEANGNGDYEEYELRETRRKESL